jgi:hypothetical protein
MVDARIEDAHQSLSTDTFSGWDTPALYIGFTATSIIVLDLLAQNQTCGSH